MTEAVIEEVEKQTDEEIVAVEKEEAQAGQRGFDKVHKLNDDLPSADIEKSEDDEEATEIAKLEAQAQKEADDEVKAKAEADAKAKDDEKKKEAERQKFNDELPDTIRRLDGRLGEVIGKINDLATVKAAPIKEEVKPDPAALTDPEAMNTLIKEYDEFEPMQKELLAIRSELAKVTVSPDTADLEARMFADLEVRLADMEERIQLRGTHPDWETTVSTPEFLAWTLEGGPSTERYIEMNAQTDPAKATETVNGWAREFPQWWADRGVNIFSSKATDSIKLLSSYSDHIKVTNAAEAKRLKQEKDQKRLAGAVTVTGTGELPETGISDIEAGNRGFNRVMKRA